MKKRGRKDRGGGEGQRQSKHLTGEQTRRSLFRCVWLYTSNNKSARTLNVARREIKKKTVRAYRSRLNDQKIHRDSTRVMRVRA